MNGATRALAIGRVTGQANCDGDELLLYNAFSNDKGVR